MGLARARWESIQRSDEELEDLGGLEERFCLANNYAVALMEVKDDRETAMKLLQGVLLESRRKLGDNDPSTLESMVNLSMQYTEMSQFEKALPLATEAFEGMRRTAGPEHPHTLVAMHGLASLYAAMHDYEKAKPLHDECLAARRRTLGKSSSETMESMSGLGHCLVAMQGDVARGIALLAEAAATARRVLGPGHTDTTYFEARLNEARAQGRSTMALRHSST